MTYLLLSYPRSGNTWVRYFIEYISKRPTVGYEESFGKFDSPLLSKNPIEPIAIKRHSIVRIDYTGFILILRNPKECILRHCDYDSDKVWAHMHESFTVDKYNVHSGYLHNIRQYDKYKGPKHLIYYEDIIGDCEGFYPLAEFLGYDAGDFFENLEHHRNECIKIYDKYDTSTTKGKSAIYHSEKMDCSFIDDIIQHHELGKKYLTRYL